MNNKLLIKVTALLISAMYVFFGIMPTDAEASEPASGSSYSVADERLNGEAFFSGMNALDLQTGIMYIDGEKKLLSVIPYGYDKTLVPLKEFSEKANLRVTEDESAKQIIVGQHVRYRTDTAEFLFDGASADAGGEILNINNTLYVPVVSLLEKGFAKKVSYFNFSSDPGFIVFGDRTYSLPANLSDRTVAAQYIRYYKPDAARILSDFDAGNTSGCHPRLFARDSKFESIIASQIPGGNLSYVDYLVNRADTANGVIELALAYQFTKKTAYAQSAYTNIKNTIDESIWASGQYLDVGTIAMTVAFVYDLIYKALTPQQQVYIQQGLKRQAIDETIKWYKGETGNENKFIKAPTNWNEVCNGGVAIAALALLDVYPAECSYLLEKILLSTEYYLDSNFLKSGASFEGPSYYIYGKLFLWPMLEALESTLGTTYNLIEIPGFYNSLEYIMNMHNGKKLLYNYSDCDETYQIIPPDILFYAKKSGQRDLAKRYCEYIKSFGNWQIDSWRIFRLMLYGEDWMFEPDYSLPLDNIYPEKYADIGVFRSSWNDADGTYVGFKTSTITPFASHAQMDNGSFVFDSMGERWVSDMGKENYYALGGTVYDMWNMQNGRWHAFRNNALGHSTVVVNPDSNYPLTHGIGAGNSIMRFESSKSKAIGVLELYYALRNDTTTAKRGFLLTDNRTSLVIRDEMHLVKSSDVYWSIFTKASNAEISGNRIILTQNGKRMAVDYVSNGISEAKFVDAAPHNGFTNESQNEEYKRLTIKLRANGDLNITVKFTPLSSAPGQTSVSAYDKSIDSWSLTEPVLKDSVSADMTSLDGETDYYSGDGSGVFNSLYNMDMPGSKSFIYDTAKGVYGKDADDVSAHISTDSSQSIGNTYIDEIPITARTYKAGDFICFKFNHASAAKRGFSPGIEFESNAYTSLLFLSVSNLGRITFADTDCGGIPDYLDDRWHEYCIVIKILSDCNKVSLYIDGDPFAENLNIGTSAITDITKFRLCFNGKAHSAGDSSEVFVDDINVDFYLGGVPEQKISTSSLNNSVVSREHCIFTNSEMSVDAFLNSLRVDGGYTMEVLNKSFNFLEGTMPVTDGYLKLTLGNRTVYKNVQTRPYTNAATIDMSNITDGFYADWPYSSSSSWAGCYLIDYKRVTGVYGKDSSDVSALISSESGNLQYLTGRPEATWCDFSAVTDRTYSPGDTLVFNFKFAMSVGRDFNIKMVCNAGNCPSALSISECGDIILCGTNVGTIPEFSMCRWYNVSLAVASGTPNTVSLYIDGVKTAAYDFGSTPITSVSEFKMSPIGAGFWITGPADFGIYLDDIIINHYTSDTPEQAIELTSESPAIKCKADGTILADSTLTASRLLSAVALPRNCTAKYVDMNFSEIPASSHIENGYLKISGESGVAYRNVNVSYCDKIYVRSLAATLDASGVLTCNGMIYNNSNSGLAVNVILSFYKGNKLTGIDIEKISVAANDKSAIRLTSSFVGEYDNVFAFVWKNNFVPVSAKQLLR